MQILHFSSLEARGKSNIKLHSVNFVAHFKFGKRIQFTLQFRSVHDYDV